MNNEYENGLYGTNLKYFKSGSAFLEYVDDTSSLKEYPNAAIIDNETLTKKDPKVIYNWELTERQRYELLYFTIKIAGEGTSSVTCKIPPKLDTTCIRSISYSTDGENWTTVENSDNRTDDINILTDPIGSGSTVMFKADADYLSIYNGDDDEYYQLTFSTAGNTFDIEGNIMSLFYDDDFINKDEIQSPYETDTNYYYPMTNLFSENTELHSAKNLILPNKIIELCYSRMFADCTSLVEAPKLLATELASNCYSSMFAGCISLTEAPELPATKLAERCYSQMFYGCTSLTEAPELPATELTEYCYPSMFYGCTSLVNVPAELPATKLTERCYFSMFHGCTSLVNAPILPATKLAYQCYFLMFEGCTSLVNVPVELPAIELASSCYSSMFNGCTSLVNAPKLPGTELASSCYSSMFNGCTSLVNAPILPTTKLASSCYSNMFYGCTSLVNAPKLPGTELANSCYYLMFKGCTSLAVAPDLPATELISSCYYLMFDGCTNLRYIKMMAKQITKNSAYPYTGYWVRNVSTHGTFIKNADAEYSSYNQHAIPLNSTNKWTVITEKPAEIESDNELVLTNESNPIVYGILRDGGLDSRHADPNGWTADELASLTLEDIYNYTDNSDGIGNAGFSIFYRFDNEYSYDRNDPRDIEGEDRMWTFDEFKYFKGISIIPSNCFRACWGLKSITIPSSVVYLQGGAFHDCWWLEKIILEDSDNKLTIDDGLYSDGSWQDSAFNYAGLRYFNDTEDWTPSFQLGVSEEDLVDGRYISPIDRLKKTNVLIGDRTITPRYNN